MIIDTLLYALYNSVLFSLATEEIYQAGQQTEALLHGERRDWRCDA
jgi:hypothetical protein